MAEPGRIDAESRAAAGAGPPARRRARALLPALLACLAVSSLACGEAPSGGGDRGLVILPGDEPQNPDLAERPFFHDFGHVPDGDVARHTFRLRNESPGPVEIQRVNPSCGCTVPSLAYVAVDGTRVEAEDADAEPVLVVPPGAVVELELRIATKDVRSKNVDKLMTTQLVTGSDATPFLQLETHIVVENPFQMTPPTVDVPMVPQGGGATVQAEIATLQGYGHRLTGVQEKPDWLDVELREDQRYGRPVWTVTLRFLPPLSLGRKIGHVLLTAVDGEGQPYRPFFVGVTATIVEDVQVEPGRLVLVADRGSATPAEARVTLRSLVPGQRLAVTSVDGPAEHAGVLEAEHAAVAPDASGRAERWTIVLRTRPPVNAEVLQGFLTVHLDDPQTPTREIPFVLHLRP